MKALKLRELTVDELKKKLQDLRLEGKNLRFARSRGELKNLLKIREARRDIARILTILKEKAYESSK
jgi:large subunit ribosomal protein L29